MFSHHTGEINLREQNVGLVLKGLAKNWGKGRGGTGQGQNCCENGTGVKSLDGTRVTTEGNCVQYHRHIDLDTPVQVTQLLCCPGEQAELRLPSPPLFVCTVRHFINPCQNCQPGIRAKKEQNSKFSLVLGTSIELQKGCSDI